MLMKTCALLWTINVIVQILRHFPNPCKTHTLVRSVIDAIAFVGKYKIHKARVRWRRCNS